MVSTKFSFRTFTAYVLNEQEMATLAFKEAKLKNPDSLATLRLRNKMDELRNIFDHAVEMEAEVTAENEAEKIQHLSNYLNGYIAHYTLQIGQIVSQADHTIFNGSKEAFVLALDIFNKCEDGTY